MKCKKTKLIKGPFILFVCLVPISLSSCENPFEEAPHPEGWIRIPDHNSSFVDKSCRDIYYRFIDAGFKNVRLFLLKDLVTGWLKGNLTVKTVEIDYHLDYRKSYIRPSALVKINVHSFLSTAVPSYYIEPTGMMEVGKSSDSFEKMNKDDTLEYLTTAGFKNIEQIALGDLDSTSTASAFSTSKVVIASLEEYYENTYFAETDLVTIYYHSYAEPN